MKDYLPEEIKVRNQTIDINFEIPFWIWSFWNGPFPNGPFEIIPIRHIKQCAIRYLARN